MINLELMAFFFPQTADEKDFQVQHSVAYFEKQPYVVKNLKFWLFHKQKKMNLNLSLTHYTKIKSKLITDLTK